MTAIPLDTFFAEMAELLAGRRTAAECEAVLGRSTSGTARFGVYAKLVDRQQRAAIESLFRATLVAASAWDADRCEALRAGFLRETPPAHWSPTVVAAPFADYLEAHGAPSDVVELADFARTRAEVLRAPQTEGIGGLAVRHYTHAVREFTLAVESGQLTAGRPATTSTTWLLGRHRETAALVLLVPSLATLVALQVVDDGGWSAELPPVDRDDVHAVASFLVEQGLLSPSSLATVREAR